MPVMINGENYYRTAEVCLMVGIGKTTLYRWMREKITNEAEYRDRNGWRLFNENEIDRLKMEVNRVQKGFMTDDKNMPRIINIGKDYDQRQPYIKMASASQ